MAWSIGHMDQCLPVDGMLHEFVTTGRAGAIGPAMTRYRKRKKRRPHAFEDGAGLTEITDLRPATGGHSTPASEGSGGEVEKLLGLAFHVQANILMRLVARDPRDALYEVENRFWRPAFLKQHGIDDLRGLEL